MSKTSATIHSSVRHGATVYTPGMEDELHKVLDKGSISRLTDAGVISGFGAKAHVEEVPAETAPETPAEEAPAPADTRGKAK